MMWSELRSGDLLVSDQYKELLLVISSTTNVGLMISQHHDATRYFVNRYVTYVRNDDKKIDERIWAIIKSQ